MTPNRTLVASRIRALPWIAIFAALLAPTTVHADTSFRMAGDPGDWISGGASYWLTPADGSFGASRNYDGGVSVNFSSPAHWWYLDFAGPLQRPLHGGVYAGAVRFPFQSLLSAGLSVSGDGRGCNTLTGTFWVRQAEYGPSNTVTRFWATFEQHCEGGVPAARGEIRFNADTASYVLPPADLFVMRREAVHFDVDAVDTRGQGVALVATGLPPGATFVDHHDGRGTFDWPAGAPDTGTVVVAFTAVSDDGHSAQGATAIHVYGSNQLSMQSDPGDYIGLGRTYLFTEGNAWFSMSRNYQNGVSFNVTSGDEWWYLDFSAPGQAPLQVGSYPGAIRFPFNDSAPGLSVYGDGRGCNTLTGRFDVLDVQYGSGGTILSFWATFEQHCEGGAPALKGAIRMGIDLPVATTLALVRADALPGRNRLEWYADGAAGLPATVQRRTTESDWRDVGAATADGAGHLTFEDTDLAPRSRYAYRLSYSINGVQALTAETWLDSWTDHPLALEGLRPNPAFEDLSAAFTLADAGPASLELVDVAGRRMLTREVGSLGGGPHVLSLGSARALPPGTYWLRLRQGGETRVKTAILTR